MGTSVLTKSSNLSTINLTGSHQRATYASPDLTLAEAISLILSSHLSRLPISSSTISKSSGNCSAPKRNALGSLGELANPFQTFQLPKRALLSSRFRRQGGDFNLLILTTTPIRPHSVCHPERSRIERKAHDPAESKDPIPV